MPHQPAHNSYPPWSPRFWNGMSLRPYCRLMAEQGFRIHPLRWPMFGLGLGVSIVNSVLNSLQRWGWSQAIADTPVSGPVFILGHWRSGTTLMHELLIQDPRWAFPTNFDVFCSSHLFVSRPVFEPLINLLLPRNRPMDGMAVNAWSPQEDDFALISLGGATLYRDIAFPNRRFAHTRNQLCGETPAEIEAERAALEYFFRVLSRRYRKPLVLKSPPHTARIARLAEWFPDAKFIHIARHPYQIVPSTEKLWSALDWTQGFQLPRYSSEQMGDYIHRVQTEMYSHYFAARAQLGPERLVEIRFEDLLANPPAVMEGVYRHWKWDGWESIRPAWQRYFAERPNAGPTRRELSETVQGTIRRHWGDYAAAFGYEW